MRRLKWLKRYFVAVLAFAVLAAVGSVSMAHAQTRYGNCDGPDMYGRRLCQGYLSGQYPLNYFTGDQLVMFDAPALLNVYDASAFINRYSGYLNGSNEKHKTSAAITIDVMLGKNGPEFGNSKTAGITYARDHFNEWADLVRSYDSRGLIDWTRSVYNNREYTNSSMNPSALDMYMGMDWEDATTLTIRFNNPDGSEPFVLDKWCGNLRGKGRLTGVETPKPAYVPDIQNATGQPGPLPGNGSSNSPGSGVYPGQTLKFNLLVRNAGNARGQDARIQGKVFSLDPSAGQPYNYYDAGCSGSCYNTPDKTTAPQRGIVYATGAGILYNPSYQTNMSALNAGQSFTAPPNGAQSSPYSMSYVVPSDAVDGRKICFYGHVDPSDEANGVALTNFGGMCFIVQRPVIPACSGASASPVSLDPGTQYAITSMVTFNESSAVDKVFADPSTRFFVRVVGPTGSGLDRTLTYAAGAPEVKRVGLSVGVTTALQPATNRAGEYTVTYGVTGGTGAIGCGGTSFSVTNKPYFEVKNGDLTAGAGMNAGGTDCAVARNDNASIVSWNRGSAGNYGGAGTQYAALALNRLQDFASGQGSALAPGGVSFANTTEGQLNIAGGLFGGKFGAVHCTADYFANATGVQSGPYVLNAKSVADGTHQVLFVDGDVYVKGNVTFSGSYANTAAVPSFAIVARGNIYIDPSVTQLDGFYVAQPASASDTKGNIYTCANDNVPAALNRTLQNSCSNRLVINGAFVARQVWLLRTYGTVSGDAAESFNYSPELWLSAPFGNNLSQARSDYDSITSLPPIL